MEIVPITFLLIGFIISLIYGIKLLILAFQESILWGLGSLFLGIVGLIFVLMHWETAKGPFLKSLLAIPCFMIAVLLSPDTATTMP